MLIVVVLNNDRFGNIDFKNDLKKGSQKRATKLQFLRN
jgi:hypothetical protein